MATLENPDIFHIIPGGPRLQLAGAEDKLSFEYSAIWVSNILPWIGRNNLPGG